MSSVLAVDSAAGKRVFLVIQNLATPGDPLYAGVQGRIGVAFDQDPGFTSMCSIHIYPGGSLVFDTTVPQNRVFLVSDSDSAIPAGIVVSNVV